MKNKKVKLKISFNYECEVIADDENEAFDKATDNAMDYFEKTLRDSRKFDEFWEYQIKITKDDIYDIE